MLLSDKRFLAVKNGGGCVHESAGAEPAVVTLRILAQGSEEVRPRATAAITLDAGSRDT